MFRRYELEKEKMHKCKKTEYNITVKSETFIYECITAAY